MYEYTCKKCKIKFVNFKKIDIECFVKSSLGTRVLDKFSNSIFLERTFPQTAVRQRIVKNVVLHLLIYYY